MDYMILTEYLIYAAIIVVGIFILLLIKRKTRLPNHNELNNRLRAHLNTLEQFLKIEREHPSNGYDFFRKITKFIYTTDRLAYTTNLLAEKERIGDLDNISQTLYEVENLLAPYKFGLREGEDFSEYERALAKVRECIRFSENLLARDKQLKGRA